MRPPCGTPAGHKAHLRHAEPGCQPCMHAKADYTRACRIITGTNQAVLVPVALLRQLLADPPVEALLAARRELGPRTVAAVRRTAQPLRDQAVAS